MEQWIDSVEWLDDKEIECLPMLLAGEYRRLRELVDLKDFYGAQIQLKDVVEIIIKLYAGIGLAEVINYTNKTSKDFELLSFFTSKVLSLGDWAGVVHELSSKSVLLKPELVRILNGINGLTDPEGYAVVVWRNKTIGHGALGHYDNATFQESFIRIISAILRFLKENIIDISTLKILEDDQKSVIYYSYLSSKVNLSPFIIPVSNDIYIFDSYDHSKHIVDYLDYHEGKWLRFHRDNPLTNQIQNTYLTSRKAVEGIGQRNKVCALYESPESFFAFETEALIKELTKVNSSVHVEYIEKWITDKISNSSKGIYIYSAPGGTGKTVFSQHLEKGEIKLNGVSIGVVHINDSYNSTTLFVIQEISDAFESNRIKGFDIPHIDINSSNPNTELISFLKKIKERDFYVKQNDKVLLVIDGLDELGEKNIDFLRFIPRVQDLVDGVNILITCRPKEEMNEGINRVLNDLMLPDNVLYYDSDKMTDIMKQYAEREGVSVSKTDLCEWIKRNDANFALLHFCVLIQKGIQIADEGKLLDVSAVLGKYIDYVSGIFDKLYVSKYFEALYVLMSIDSGLSIKELSYLIGENSLSFSLVGILNDLKGIIKSERKHNNEYSIIHSEIKDQLWKQLSNNKLFSEASKRVTNNMKDILWELVENESTDLDSSSFYKMLSYIFTREELWNDSDFNRFLTAENLFELFRKVVIASESIGTSNGISDASIYLCKKMDSCFEKDKPEDIKTVLLLWESLQNWQAIRIENRDVFIKKGSRLHECQRNIEKIINNETPFSFLKKIDIHTYKKMSMGICGIIAYYYEYHSERDFAIEYVKKQLNICIEEGIEDDGIIIKCNLSRLLAMNQNTEEAQKVLASIVIDKKKVDKYLFAYINAKYSILHNKPDYPDKNAAIMIEECNEICLSFIKEHDNYDPDLVALFVGLYIDMKREAQIKNGPREVCDESQKLLATLELMPDYVRRLNFGKIIIVQSDYLFTLVFTGRLYKAKLYKDEIMPDLLLTCRMMEERVKTSEDERMFVWKKNLLISVYIIDRIFKPDMVEEIDYCKNGLGAIVIRWLDDEIQRLNDTPILSDRKHFSFEWNDLNMSFFVEYIDSRTKLLCIEKRIGKLKGEDTYVFNKKNCSECSRMFCPAHCPPHQISQVPNE